MFDTTIAFDPGPGPVAGGTFTLGYSFANSGRLHEYRCGERRSSTATRSRSTSPPRAVWGIRIRRGVPRLGRRRVRVVAAPGAGNTDPEGGVPAGGNAGAFANGFTTGPEAFSRRSDNSTGVVSIVLDQSWRCSHILNIGSSWSARADGDRRQADEGVVTATARGRRHRQVGRRSSHPARSAGREVACSSRWAFTTSSPAAVQRRADARPGGGFGAAWVQARSREVALSCPAQHLEAPRSIKRSRRAIA